MRTLIKYLFFILFSFLSIFFVYNHATGNSITISNKYLINYLKNGFDYVNIINDKNASDIKFSPKDLLSYNNKNIYYIENNKKEETVPVVKEGEEDKESNEEKLPFVYIYNTHNKEEYYHSVSEPHNIVPTVMTTSYMLKERLKEHNIESIVEEKDVSSVLKKKKWKYSYSYKVTKSFLEEAVKTYPSLKFFIDVHRDSVKKEISTVEINKKPYARILFIVGLENKDYEKNLKLTEEINNLIKKEYPGLSRGIYKKKGSGVNGVYNQDFSPNCILIEFGAEKNTIDEVYNSVEAVGGILGKYIGDNYET